MRTVLFWTHLTAGVTAGVFILIMCVTGAALAYERQINTWVDHRDIHMAAPTGAARLGAEELLAKVAEQRPGGNALTVYADPGQPSEVSLGREGTLFVDPYTGSVVAQSRQTSTRAFFRAAEDLHRWLAMGSGARGVGRNIMDAANLVFFGIVLSGLYLWFPRNLTWQRFRGSLFFRGGLKGKARDWNWHNVIGIWSWVPLFLIVGSGVVMSYPWASDLLYTMTGSPLPPRFNPGQGFGPGPGNGANQAKGKGPDSARGKGAPKGGERQEGPPGFGGPFGGRDGRPVQWQGLDAALVQAQAKVDGWSSIRVQGSGNPKAPFNFSIDRGNGGQPQLRATLVVDRESGAGVFTDFSAGSTGQKLRLLARFTHTGESLGLLGQTIAGAATAGGAVMVYTGIALALRRFLAWRRWTRAVAEQAVAETV